MNDRQRRSTTPDAGFSLIELIVAITIVGILTAMAVPSYLGLQSSVREAATQSDLGNDRTALVAYGIDNNGVYPTKASIDTSSGSALAGYGWQRSPETNPLQYLPNADRTSWCLQGTSATGTVFRVSPKNPVLAGTCSAIGEANY